MYHPKANTRRQLILRILGRGATVLLILITIVVSLLYMLGYGFNFGEKKLEQSGLVQFITTPSGGTVEIDGATLPAKTPAKASVSPGVHEFVMWHEGYETWRKQLTIASGTLTWLNYTRLIPKERPVEAIHQLSITPTATSIVSKDHRFMAALPDSTNPELAIYDLTRDTVPPPAVYRLPSDSYRGATQQKAHRFSLVDWDGAGRFILIRHQLGGTTEWLAFDRQTGKLRGNISQTMDLDIQDMVIMDESGAHYLALIAGDVRKIDLAAETLSRPLVSDVSGFTLDPTSGAIAYVEVADKATGHRKVGIMRANGRPVTMYRSDAPLTTPLFIKTAHYFSQDYVTIVEGNKTTIYSGDFPANENDTMQEYAVFSTAAKVSSLYISPSGRFVIAQYGSQFVGYDIERKSISPPARLPKGSSSLRWLDDFILYYEHKGTLTVREFDGANMHDLHGVAPGFSVTLSQNGKYLYSVGLDKSGHPSLQRLRMILD